MTGQVRVRLDVAYDGTDFHGWARQKGPQEGLRTVAGVLEDALSLVVREPVELVVAGRTDAGVHADGQVAHVDLPSSAFEQRSLDRPEALVRRLSRMLPTDIRLHGATAAPEGFDARFSALSRRYRYRVTTADAGVLPVRARDTATWRRDVDLAAVQTASDVLVGLHDFAAFCKYRPNATTVRELQEFTWRDVSTVAEPNTYEATVVADAFCWSMVRSLVGAVLSVGEGRRDEAFTRGLLDERSRSSEVAVAPACGLNLVEVHYPPQDEMAARVAVTRDRRAPVDAPPDAQESSAEPS